MKEVDWIKFAMLLKFGLLLKGVCLCVLSSPAKVPKLVIKIYKQNENTLKKIIINERHNVLFQKVIIFFNIT